MKYNEYLAERYKPFDKLWEHAMRNFNAFSYNSPRITQPLTQEQIQKLRTDSEAFDMKVTQEELWAACCVHHDKNGKSTLKDNKDGSSTCSICHKTFRLDDISTDVETTVANIISSLQTPIDLYDTPNVKRPAGLLHPDEIDFANIDIDKLWKCFKLADQYNIDSMSELERMTTGFRGLVFFSEIEGKEDGIAEFSLEELANICSIWREDAQYMYYRVYSGEFLMLFKIELYLDYIKLFESLITNNISPNSKKAKTRYNRITKKWNKFLETMMNKIRWGLSHLILFLNVYYTYD